MKKRDIITIENLSIGFDDHVLLKDINFTVQAGSIFMILGGSGAGKTTLLRHIIGLNTPISGSIIINGLNILDAQGENRRALLKQFGVTYQSGALFSNMTLFENVRLPLEEHTNLPAEAMDELALQKLHLVELADYAYYYPSEISGGMQKRTGIARAMALSPALLFLDEPSAGLDPITSLELDELIKKLSKLLGVTFVIVTHELASIFNIGTHVVVLDKETQSIVAEGDPRELRDHCQIPLVKSLLNRERIL